ncbi:response regulator [Psychrobacillus glaciei]|uniref:Response regulator n=1 Tax=Psychrobacillus glaciei TaxID=2283160 RepID=A0A5J6SJM9_9BACI|nr:response regulator [Psychrobacillus glaciei]QFF98090.1 response regulator [Psychrobacillus glaciei]
MATILVTDDTAFMRIRLKDLLTELGHEVIGEAENGKTSVEKYEKLQPDLVMMDITMPEMDGIEALIAIKKNFPDAKIIMCSAMGQKRMVLEAIQAGAKDFLIKPFTKARIEEAVAKLI